MRPTRRRSRRYFSAPVQVLEQLIKAGEDGVRAEVLCRDLSLARNTVAQAIRRLRKDGLVIESVPGLLDLRGARGALLGYRLGWDQVARAVLLLRRSLGASLKAGG